MVCRRLSASHFETLTLTQTEIKATSGQGKTVSGFLAWRRTLLVPCTIGGEGEFFDCRGAYGSVTV